MSTPEIELWTFGGSRVWGKQSKRIHAWFTPKDGEMLFETKGSFTVGSVYKVNVLRTEEKVSMVGKPEYTGERISDKELLDSISAKHRAAEITLQMKARERADKKDDPVEEAIERLVKLSAHIPSGQRVAFAAYVTQKLTKAWISGS